MLLLHGLLSQYGYSFNNVEVIHFNIPSLTHPNPRGLPMGSHGNMCPMNHNPCMPALERHNI